MRIVILGAPGTGKRAQTELLAEKYGLESLTAGKLVKLTMAEPDGYGPQVAMLHAAGQQIPDDLLLNLLQERLCRPEMATGFVLNGFPRNLLQALTLDESLAELGQPLDLVLLINIETDALMELLVGRRTCRSCGALFNIYTHPAVVEGVCDHCGGRLHQRADDNEETVSSRLHVFEHLTHPLLDHYGKQGKLLQVDGEGSTEQVFDRICQVMDEFLKDRALEQKQSGTETILAVAEASPPYMKENSKADVGASPAPKAVEAKPSKASRGAKKKTAPKKAVSAAPSRAKKSATKKKAPSKSVKQTRPKVQKKVVSKKKSTVKKTSAKSVSAKKKPTKKPLSSKKRVVQKKQMSKKKTVKKLLSKKKRPVSTAKKKLVGKKKVVVNKKKATAKKKVVAKKPTIKKPVKVTKKSLTKKQPSRPVKKVVKKKAAQSKRPVKAAPKKKAVKKAAVATSSKKSKKKAVSRKQGARR